MPEKPSPSQANPFYRNPDHPNFNRRARHHDYTRPAKYLITIIKNPILPPFSTIQGNPFSKASTDIQVSLSQIALHLPETITAWTKKYPILIPEFIIMPDHLHLCMDVYSNLPNGLSRAVGNLMGMISSRYHYSLAPTMQPSKMTSFFSKGFNDRIAYDTQQWERQKQYTADNPRRYLMKKHFPDYLLTKWLLTLPPLPSSQTPLQTTPVIPGFESTPCAPALKENRRYILKGNIFLLRQPYLFQVKTSRHFSSAEAAEAMKDWQGQLFNGGVPISPFIHPHEKELRDFAIKEGFPYIRVCTNGFAEREAASGLEFELMSQGRLLLIGQSTFSSRKEDLRYSYAQSLNRLAAEMVSLLNSGHTLSLRRI